ncbi:MAG TPA: hypothetical protein VNM87_07050, partial [Candidatus Udaeobacter sp.]|nr:hypothetical protein [Candidatus Udaeobacter sp.]
EIRRPEAPVDETQSPAGYPHVAGRIGRAGSRILNLGIAEYLAPAVREGRSRFSACAIEKSQGKKDGNDSHDGPFPGWAAKRNTGAANR